MISAISPSPVPLFKPPSAAVRQKTSSQSLNLAEKPKDAPEAAGKLSDEEKAQVEKLKKTDREVRAHEQAHKNAGGQFAGSASFGYVAGPDGRRYAVSGEVPIDIAPVEGDAQATISKMNVVASAALAPAKPSGQDRRVAAQAAAIRSEAQAELSQKFQEKISGDGEDGEEKSTLSAISAYEKASFPVGNENISGNILNLFS